MSSRLFRVDMSDASRDFAAVATEPGLAMLDAQRVNYGILYKWLGPLAAEPELQGTQMVSFYVREQERGRLESVTCWPATKKDLEGPLKADFETLEQGIRKAKPESATEQALHRIIAKSFRELTADLDTSDFHHYFFKYRNAAEPPRLAWCWGYQRKDMEPARTLICTKEDCNQLFVHKPNGSKRCPACSTVPVKKRTGAGVLLRPAYLALALLLLLALFAWFTWPRLVVTPDVWQGPRGSNVSFQVVDSRWYFFETDVTNKALPKQDEMLIEFSTDAGAQGRAIRKGVTGLTFTAGTLQSSPIKITVGAAPPAKSISIDPAPVKVPVDGSKTIRVVGHYDDMDDLDLTADEAKLTLGDESVAQLDGLDLRGKYEGLTLLTAIFSNEKAEAQVEVSGAAAGGLWVSPTTVSIPVGSIQKMSVESKDLGDITTTSSNESVAAADSPDPFLHNIVAVAEGEADVTFTQGENSVVVHVSVVKNDIQSVRIEPEQITLYEDEESYIRLLGERADGTTVDIGSDQILVVRQPRVDYAPFERDRMSLFGLAPTPRDEQLILKYNFQDKDLTAEASVRVEPRRGTAVAVAAEEDDWAVYPPLGVGPAVTAITGPMSIPGGTIFGNGAFYDPTRGLVLGDTLPPALVGKFRPGDVITSLGGHDITSLRDPNLLFNYINGLGAADVVTVMGIDNPISLASLGVFRDVDVPSAQPINVTATDFGAELQMVLREPGEYRIATDAGPVTDWAPFAAGATSVQVMGIPRDGNKAKYLIYVERKTGGNPVKYPFTIELN